MWGAIVAAIIAFIKACLERKPATPIQEVEEAHAVEDKNLAELRDGDAAERLRAEFSK